MTTEEEFDTIVVSAREHSFKKLFIEAGCWYPIFIEASRIHKIRYIAVYRVAPISSITHIGPVKHVERWNGSPKYKIVLSGHASELGPIRLDKQGRVKQLQSHRYTSFSKLQRANTLDDIWQ